MPHLTSRWPDSGLEARTLKIYSTLRDGELAADVVHGVIRFQGVQTISLSDTSAHPAQFLSARLSVENRVKCVIVTCLGVFNRGVDRSWLGREPLDCNVGSPGA